MRSFDLFDTLLGRFHYKPESIFELVEERFPFPGFVLFRLAAELRSDGTLADIYRKLGELIDISKEELARLMDCEFASEQEQIFPIVENLGLVQEGDLIVSDTYYDTAQIEALLQKLGFTQKVRIYASPRGKSSGAGWALLQKAHDITSHLGDSAHSDVAMAKLYNIEGIHYTNGQLSPEERHLLGLGQSQLSYLCRALRLSNPYETNSLAGRLWNDQCKWNVPILIHASLYLHQFCQAKAKRRILFTSRDGCLWIQIFRQLFPEYELVYFHASRHTYRYPTDAYIEYVKSVYSDDAVIVDSHGRGASCELFFMNHFQTEPTYLAIVNVGEKHHAIVRSKPLYEEIEMLNYDTCGTLYDVQNGMPLRCAIEYPVEYVLPMHACIAKCVEMLPHYKLDTFDLAVISHSLESMKGNLAISDHFLHARYHCHIQGEAGLHHFHIKHVDE